MPDETLTTTAEPSTPAEPSPAAGVAAPPETAAPAADPYDAAYTTTMEPPAPEQDSEPKVEQAAPPLAPALKVAPLTDGETSVLKRSGLEPTDVAGWSRQRIEQYVQFAGKVQRDADALGARAGNAAKPKEEPRAAEPAPPGEFTEDLTKVFDALATSYDADIKPLGELLSRMEAANAGYRQQAAQHAQVMPAIADLVTDLVMDVTLDSMVKEYPSLSAQEARQKVVDRFWTEWATGAYAKEGTGLRAQMREALANSAKVVFLNTTEQSAVASLVTKNKGIVAAQPKPGGANSRSAPKTKSDVYDEAFDQFLAPEVGSGRR